MTVRTGQICQLWTWNMILGVKNCWTEFKNLGRFDIKTTKCPILTRFGSEKNSNILNWWPGPRSTILGQFVSKSYICSNFYEIQHLEGVYTWNFILGWNSSRDEIIPVYCEMSLTFTCFSSDGISSQYEIISIKNAGILFFFCFLSSSNYVSFFSQGIELSKIKFQGIYEPSPFPGLTGI